MAAPLTDLAPPQLASDDGLEHMTCCSFDDDGTVALCGADVADLPWGAGPHAVDCVVCLDLSAADSCPWFGRCSQRPDWAE